MLDDIHGFQGLPNPVRGYLEHVLPEHLRPVREVRVSQTGVLRTDPHNNRWMRFQADQVVWPMRRRFSWDARVRILPLVHVRVRDEYCDGAGSGRVQLLSAVTVGSDRDTPELNAASLHRFLAEAVWYPTALLPSEGVEWTPIDDRSAQATLSDSGNTVSLEFRFNREHEVTGIYAPGRWRRSGQRYVLTPWEGHFSDHRRHEGILVPSKGEVGWHVDGKPEIVWKGDITSLEYEFEPIPG